MPLDHAAQVVMVGNHTGNFAVQFIAVPAVQQVRQAVGLAAGHQYHAFFLLGIGDLPGHGELFSDRRKRLAERLKTKGQRIGTDFVTHEEPTAEVVRVMARLGDPTIVGGQKVTDFGNDADPVRASNHQPKSAH